ncbi:MULTISPECIES: hypothetical protein [Propionibacterium]|uniref:hypothetical protein n=1 Tax=Propionibacterium TaxID=1743 RepID=UPI000BC2F5DA|nr:hypothetical protein [Propionibacterium freudenreichii]SBN95976.1 Hypothetical protein PFR_JS12-2_1592 [Propionibacterium freudenreichii]SBT29668.1 Hypothetical protein PFR_JS14_1509 [Propionibacterium freudenreichii]SCC97562.1 Hypothetical protein PFR_JS12-1_1594 [Propionibacterium freudenreichii]
MQFTRNHVPAIAAALTLAASLVVPTPAQANPQSANLEIETAQALSESNPDIWASLTSDQQTSATMLLLSRDLKDGLPASDAEAKAISPMLSVTRNASSPNIATNSIMVTARGDWDWTVLGISYASVHLEYTYFTDPPNVSSDAACSTSYSNRIPLREISFSTDHWVADGKGFCNAHYTISTGGGWGDTRSRGYHLRVNGNGVEDAWESES